MHYSQHLHLQHEMLLLTLNVFFYSVVGTSLGNFLQDNYYDFVIVGGGTAGCVLAARLSENGKHSVLLLEAGEEPHPDLDVPALTTNFLGDPRYLRTYQSVPQHNAGLANNGILETITGKALGGSSSVNSMIWNRGSPFDFDNWARITNDSSWNYAKLLQFFKKSENYMGRFPSDQHGHGGPVTVSRPNYAPMLQEWLEAGRHLGFPNGDPNGPQRISYTSLEFSKRFGRRVSSYSGYLKPVMGRRNLRVVTGAEATQIIFEGKKAIGVRYGVNQSGRQYRRQVGVFARKEVIISAGAIESPALLLRSGIGPKHALKSVNIPQMANLPVGQNLQDHVVIQLQFVINNASFVFDQTRDLTPAAMETFIASGDGPYTNQGGFVAQAILKSSASKDNNRGWGDTVTYFRNIANTLQDVGKFHLAEWEVGITSSVIVSRPKSTGVVSLNPKNPSSLPVLDFEFFKNDQDMQVMIEGIKATLNTFERTPSFRKLGARYPPVPLAACKNFQFRSDDYWRCYIRQLAGSGLHVGGTCRMGRGSNDPDAVVDSKLRVIGIQRLRVVDASIMPAIPTTNLQAPVYAISEKAAHMILQDWELGGLIII